MEAQIYPHSIHITGRRGFRDCRRQYYYSTVERIAPKGELQSTGPLWMGTAVHHCLALYYENRRRQQVDPHDMSLEDNADLLTSWAEYQTESTLVPDYETKVLVDTMLSGYQKFSQEEDKEWKIVGVEVNLKRAVSLPNGQTAIIEGTLDLIIEWKKHLWIVDHKTAAQIPGDSQLEHDDQFTGYMWLAHEHGIPVIGVIYNALRKKIPTKPLVLASGGLSKNKSIDTTYDVYMEAIEENGLNPIQYQDMLDMLKTKNAFFIRKYLTRSKNEIASFGENLIPELLDMTNPNLPWYPNPGWRCAFCAYNFLCKVQNEKGDVNAIKQSMFQEKGDHER